MIDTKATRPPNTKRELTDAEKAYGILAIAQPDGIHVSDRTLQTALGDLPAGQPPGTALERAFPDGSKLTLLRNTTDWSVNTSKG